MVCGDLEDEQCEKQATVTNITLLMNNCTGPGLARLPQIPMADIVCFI